MTRIQRTFYVIFNYFIEFIDFSLKLFMFCVTQYITILNVPKQLNEIQNKDNWK